METTTAILDYIKSFIDARGYPPSMREIRDGVGLSSTSLVKYYLQKLQIDGKIRRTPNTPRSIVILDGGDGKDGE